LIETLGHKDKQIGNIQEMKMKEEQYITKINDLTRLYEDKSITLNNFIEKYNKLEKEYDRVLYINTVR
jgi:hypothetical protein